MGETRKESWLTRRLKSQDILEPSKKLQKAGRLTARCAETANGYFTGTLRRELVAASIPDAPGSSRKVEHLAGES